MIADESKRRREVADLRYLDPAQVRVFRTADGRVRATIADSFSVRTPRFLRVLPLTAPDRYISIFEGEPGGKDQGLLRNWRALDRASREIVQEQLARHHLHPVLRRIRSLRSFSGISLCVFETNRGVREVTLRDARDNAVHLGSSRILLTDAEGNCYDIRDVEALDAASRAYLAQILRRHARSPTVHPCSQEGARLSGTGCSTY